MRREKRKQKMVPDRKPISKETLNWVYKLSRKTARGEMSGLGVEVKLDKRKRRR